MNEDEKKCLFEHFRDMGKIEIPNYQKPSIPKEGLIVSKERQKIEFKNGEFYDKFSNTLYLNNNHIFRGEIIKGKKYILVKGEYKWPSGQTFIGTFDGNNNKIEGTLIYNEGYVYKGKFKNEKFDGKGEFKWNENELIKGKFKDGMINGEAELRKENYNMKGNFINSKAEGLINEFNIKLNNHDYSFPKFNLKNGIIEEDELIITKDDKKIILNKNININLDSKSNKKKIKPTNNELDVLKKSFNLINEIVPKYEHPSIPEEGLNDTKEGDGSNIKLGNGIIGNIDEDEYGQHKLQLSNGEKLEGRLNNDSTKYWLEEGKYTWPSGQEYSGKFNQNNKFESDDDEGELKRKNEWIYKGGFKNGKLNGHGRFDWDNKNYLESYFLNGKLNGETKIKCGNIFINGQIKYNEINEVDIIVDNNSYKINKLKNNNNENLLIIEKTEQNEKKEESYFIIHFITNEQKKIIIMEYDVVEDDEKKNLINYLNIHLYFPDFEGTSISKDGLVVENNENSNEINFENGIIYNKEKELLILRNKETFKGKLKKRSNIYLLDEGEYEWPDGQKYIGKFNENNNFEGDENSKIIYGNKWVYKGCFKDGEPNGKGEIKKENGDYIKGNFEKGKIFGEAKIKKDDIIFEGNYISSIINGAINNINATLNNHNFQIAQLTINKGVIQEENLDIQEENGQKYQIKLNEKDKAILSAENYKIFDFDENDLIKIFKSLTKIRKVNLPYFSSPLIKEGEEIIQDENDKQNATIIFPNKELFVGKMERNKDKIKLIEGEYIWPFGQRYIGKFKDNKFDSKNAELSLKENWIYEGGFKNGYFEGNGTFRNMKGFSISGYFEKGRIINEVTIDSNNYHFVGSFIDSINNLYIKVFNLNIQNHIYELSEFKMSDTKIIFKKDKIEFIKEISPEIRKKLIESLIIKSNYNKKKYIYNEPFRKEESNENQLKILKIQDNIQSQKLSTLSIHYNRLSKQNRDIKGKIGKLVGVSLTRQISLNELIYKIKENKSMDKSQLINLKSTINYFQKAKEVSKDDKYNIIEEKEIVKLCNSKMIKDLQSEIDLINKDIKTMKKEREKLEKVKSNKNKEYIDLEFYYQLINKDYNEINNKKKKLDNENDVIEENISNYNIDNKNEK